MANGPWSHLRPSDVAGDIDFEIKGEKLQALEIEFDPCESAVAEPGAMVWKDTFIQITAVFGDGSGQPRGRFMGALLGAGNGW